MFVQLKRDYLGQKAGTRIDVDAGDAEQLIKAGVADKVEGDVLGSAIARALADGLGSITGTLQKAVEEQPVTNAREVKPEETRTDLAKEQPVEQPKELQKEPQAELQPQREPQQQQVVAMVETPQAEIPTVLPRETPPDAQATIAVRREQPKVARPAEPTSSL